MWILCWATYDFLRQPIPFLNVLMMSMISSLISCPEAYLSIHQPDGGQKTVPCPKKIPFLPGYLDLWLCCSRFCLGIRFVLSQVGWLFPFFRDDTNQLYRFSFSLLFYVHMYVYEKGQGRGHKNLSLLYMSSDIYNIRTQWTHTYNECSKNVIKDY